MNSNATTSIVYQMHVYAMDVIVVETTLMSKIAVKYLDYDK